MNSSINEDIRDFIRDKLAEMHRDARETMEWTRELLDCGFEITYTAWLTLHGKGYHGKIINYESDNLESVVQQALDGCRAHEPDYHRIEVFMNADGCLMGELPEEYYREYLDGS